MAFDFKAATPGGTTSSSLFFGAEGTGATTPSLYQLGSGLPAAMANTVNATGGVITYASFSPASGKVLTVSNTLTLAGTDSTTMTFPATSSTVLTTGNTATLTVGYKFTPANLGTISTGTTTLDPALGNYQYYTNNGAHTIAAPASDCAIDILITNGASAGAITFSGFTVGAFTGDTLTLTNTNKFLLTVVRINSVATYTVRALQ